MRVRRTWLAGGLLAICAAHPATAAAQDGAEDEDEPALPAGLDAEDEDEPALPAGLDNSATVDAERFADDGWSLPFELNGFAEIRGGVRTQDDPDERRASLGEARLHIEVDRSWEPMSLAVRFAADLLYDPILDEYQQDLETGQGVADLREASLVVSPFDAVDLKIGRQIVTWGTGDLVFINDLFPKDWTAFLIGRDVEYLKAPSDAARLSVFHTFANLDLVYTPRFDADRFPDRRRLSSWDPARQQIAGRDAVIEVNAPERWFVDDEWAARLHRRVGRYELAAYGYRGFWKSPAGTDPSSGAATFPAMSAYGASVRTPLFRGIANVEAGYYDSRDDRAGDDPLIRNDELRAVVGYERELARNWTWSAQYYVEWLLDHDGTLESVPPGSPTADEVRHVVTSRLTWLSPSQTWTWSLFAFVSPTDRDAFLMPRLGYQLDDHWRADVGANLLFGRDDHTFFGQFQNNSSAYAAARYTW